MLKRLFRIPSLIAPNRCYLGQPLLFYALIAYYGIDPDEAKELLRNLDIYHPYGVVGKLPWQADRDVKPFGSCEHHRNGELISLANQIMTFTESIGDEVELPKMRNRIRDADAIVFLGFGYHRQNMDLLKTPEYENDKPYFATGIGISDSDRPVIIGRIE